MLSTESAVRRSRCFFLYPFKLSSPLVKFWRLGDLYLIAMMSPRSQSEPRKRANRSITANRWKYWWNWIISSQIRFFGSHVKFQFLSLTLPVEIRILHRNERCRISALEHLHLKHRRKSLGQINQNCATSCGIGGWRNLIYERGTIVAVMAWWGEKEEGGWFWADWAGPVGWYQQLSLRARHRKSISLKNPW